MSRDVISFEVDEDIVFLFVPPSKEQHIDFVDDIVDELGVLATASPEHKKRCIKEN